MPKTKLRDEAYSKHLNSKIEWLREIQKELKEYPDIAEDIDDKIDEIIDKLNRIKRG